MGVIAVKSTGQWKPNWYSRAQSQQQNHQNLAQNMLEAINKVTKAT